MYVTKDIVLEELGINLDLEIKKDDDPSNTSERFIKRIENWCHSYLRREFLFTTKMEDFNDLQKGQFIKGVLCQIEYVIRNGYINLQTGYNEQNGMITNLSKIKLAPDAYTEFWLGGFCNIQYGNNC